jgi:hypothetical protein
MDERYNARTAPHHETGIIDEPVVARLQADCTVEK